MSVRRLLLIARLRAVPKARTGKYVGWTSPCEQQPQDWMLQSQTSHMRTQLHMTICSAAGAAADLSSLSALPAMSSIACE